MPQQIWIWILYVDYSRGRYSVHIPQTVKGYPHARPLSCPRRAPLARLRVGHSRSHTDCTRFFVGTSDSLRCTTAGSDSDLGRGRNELSSTITSNRSGPGALGLSIIDSSVNVLITDSSSFATPLLTSTVSVSIFPFSPSTICRSDRDALVRIRGTISSARAVAVEARLRNRRGLACSSRIIPRPRPSRPPLIGTSRNRSGTAACADRNNSRNGDRFGVGDLAIARGLRSDSNDHLSRRSASLNRSVTTLEADADDAAAVVAVVPRAIVAAVAGGVRGGEGDAMTIL